MIEAFGLSKKYSINSGKKGTLRETFSNLFTKRRISAELELWALQEVTFQIDSGEIVALIGGNGSGKSTLLKVLSKITKPTSGYARIEGRLAALLEVGAGFHPELTGKENIFLSGSLLGMSRQDIRNHIDEIIAFAEIESHLDTVVKHYSSGMLVRLAFAIAVQLNSGILLLDEVLAVGDAAFQRKSFQHIHQLAKTQGRTIIFVSHDLQAVSNLTNRTLLLANGKLVKDGPTKEVVDYYLQSGNIEVEPIGNRIDRKGTGWVRVVTCRLNGQEGAKEPILLKVGEAVELSLLLKNQTKDTIKETSIVIGMRSPTGQLISWLSDGLHQRPKSMKAGGSEKWFFRLRSLPLPPGPYTLSLHCRADGVPSDWIENAISFNVVSDGTYYPMGKLPPMGKAVFYLDHTFRVE